MPTSLQPLLHYGASRYALPAFSQQQRFVKGNLLPLSATGAGLALGFAAALGALLRYHRTPKMGLPKSAQCTFIFLKWRNAMKPYKRLKDE